jgi:DNA helicase-2/ATP-dependent DNA helicase PcrA
VDGWDERQDCVSVMTLHSAKGLEFPVVYMTAVEQGLLPHERSLAKEDEVEEERRLAFVGMTRAKEELYLCHARLREFRGQSMYAVPSMFLDELPADGVQAVDLAADDRGRAMDEWRSGGRAAEAGWADAGVTPRPRPETARTGAGPAPAYAAGMLVRHDTYGVGKVTHVDGYGTSRKIKVRFSSHGEKTFIADKAKLAIVSKS